MNFDHMYQFTHHVMEKKDNIIKARTYSFALAIVELYNSGNPIFIAEQNNGYLWANFKKVLFSKLDTISTKNLHPINLTHNGELNYIHSGTYDELAAHYGLNADALSKRILKTLKA